MFNNSRAPKVNAEAYPYSCNFFRLFFLTRSVIFSCLSELLLAVIIFILALISNLQALIYSSFKNTSLSPTLIWILFLSSDKTWLNSNCNSSISFFCPVAIALIFSKKDIFLI